MHVGISIHGSAIGLQPCVPGWYQGTIDPPYNSGSGVFFNDNQSQAAVTFTRVACPPLPELHRSSAGLPSGGTIR